MPLVTNSTYNLATDASKLAQYAKDFAPTLIRSLLAEADFVKHFRVDNGVVNEKSFPKIGRAHV